jgi:anion-transporting  ArsA/GET3 family ATPase
MPPKKSPIGRKKKGTKHRTHLDRLWGDVSANKPETEPKNLEAEIKQQAADVKELELANSLAATREQLAAAQGVTFLANFNHANRIDLQLKRAIEAQEAASQKVHTVYVWFGL